MRPGCMALVSGGILLAIVCGCDRNRGPETTSSATDTADLDLREEAARIATTQGTLTAGDQNLITQFPLGVMSGARVDHIGRFERPGQPLTLQMTLEAPASMAKVADYYESAMRAKGLRVQRSASANDPNQILLMGETKAASATALVNRGVGDRPTSVSLTWTEKLVVSGEPVSAPAAAEP